MLLLKRLISSASFFHLIKPFLILASLLLLLLLSGPIPLPIITHDRVHGILKSMNVRKASGLDGIPPCVLRECASELALVPVQLFSLCLNTNTFPQFWKRAFVQPIPKKVVAL